MSYMRFQFSTSTIATLDVGRKTSLISKLQKSQQIVLSKDGYQINVGLLIERRPILLKADPLEMESIKASYQLIEKKYNLIPTLQQDLFDYYWVRPQNLDEYPTHARVIDEDNILYYHGNSKYFKHVDTNITDPKSIQYLPCYYTYYMVKKENSEQWEFPWAPVPDQFTFAEAREDFFRRLSKEYSWQIYFPSLNPYVVLRTEYPQSDGRKIKGMKTFYFLATHLEGVPEPHDSWKGEYNWVPRGHFNKYVGKPYYESFVGALQI